MAVCLGCGQIVFVSGTASIKDSKTVHVGDVKKQTGATIDNIRLVLRQAGADLGDVKQLRVYVKKGEDYNRVKKVADVSRRKRMD